MDMKTFKDKYPNEVLRALSWKQPFASLMLHGKIETRVWDSKYRGWVLICASKQPYNKNTVYQIAGENYDRYMSIVDALKDDKTASINGMAIAVGYLTSSKYMGDHSGDKEFIERKCFVGFNSELWMHEYMDVQPIVPFEWKGAQGWRTVDEETKSKIIFLNE